MFNYFNVDVVKELINEKKDNFEKKSEIIIKRSVAVDVTLLFW